MTIPWAPSSRGHWGVEQFVMRQSLEEFVTRQSRHRGKQGRLLIVWNILNIIDVYNLIVGESDTNNKKRKIKERSHGHRKDSIEPGFFKGLVALPRIRSKARKGNLFSRLCCLCCWRYSLRGEWPAWGVAPYCCLVCLLENVIWHYKGGIQGVVHRIFDVVGSESSFASIQYHLWSIFYITRLTRPLSHSPRCHHVTDGSTANSLCDCTCSVPIIVPMYSHGFDSCERTN